MKFGNCLQRPNLRLPNTPSHPSRIRPPTGSIPEEASRRGHQIVESIRATASHSPKGTFLNLGKKARWCCMQHFRLRIRRRGSRAGTLVLMCCTVYFQRQPTSNQHPVSPGFCYTSEVETEPPPNQNAKNGDLTDTCSLSAVSQTTQTSHTASHTSHERGPYPSRLQCRTLPRLPLISHARRPLRLQSSIYPVCYSAKA
ncbi:hypothetical protein K505DRAFT_146260 [Melanomma pulvis-pyrius CBS 109.77]|uniref:Uncharacterized protein n=1 Tax=Melanomma pulvis-pyrius CBS 109.77 TaxID=1314802 RepID=A0A6A6WQR1_9PLEO|nr:hypothetical protein K505DRAFT_146260 [Melanomma pulvis-pyrius CBS 109.77]